jgi:uncharacterized repeat protein (TIGR02543 family)
MLDKNPSATPTQVRTAISVGALARGASGFDNVFGYGLADALACVNALPGVDYTVTFDAQGGTAPSPASKTVTYGATYGTLATTTRTGYTFAGWWTGSGGTGSEVTSGTTVTTAANHTLYAKWIAIPTWIITQNVGANGSAAPAGSISILDGTSTSVVYTANQWFRIAALTNGATAVPAAVGARQYTNAFTAVTANHNVQVSFHAATASQAGIPSAVDPAWARSYYSSEAAAAADANLATDYMLGLDPRGAYAIGFAISSISVHGTAITVVARLKDGVIPLDTTIHGRLKVQGKNALSDLTWSDIGTATINNADFDATGMCSIPFTDATYKFYKAVIAP